MNIPIEPLSYEFQQNFERGYSLDIKKTRLIENNMSETLNDYSQIESKNIFLPSSQLLLLEIKNQKTHSFNPNNRYCTPVEEYFLPSLPQNNNKKTLVLDLDETLVHSSFEKFKNEYDYKIKVKYILYNKVDIDFKLRDVYIMIRPYLNEFLERVSKCYEIIIFTASQSTYANMVIDLIDINKVCKYRFFRDSCSFINNGYVKELKKLNRNMKSLIILDNNSNSYCLDPENGIPIKSFYEDKNDKELIQMSYVLEKLSKVYDVRPYIREIVEMNQINYDRVYELFKQRDSLDSMLKISEEKRKSKVKIVSVEKVTLTKSTNKKGDLNLIDYNNNSHNNSINNSNNYSNNNNNSNYNWNKSISQKNSNTGKSFRVKGGSVESNQNQMSKNSHQVTPFKYSTIYNSKEKEVKLLPNTTIHIKDIIRNGDKNINLNKNITRPLSKDKNFNSKQRALVMEKLEKIKRPASVIPLKAGEEKKILKKSVTKIDIRTNKKDFNKNNNFTNNNNFNNYNNNFSNNNLSGMVKNKTSLTFHKKIPKEIITNKSMANIKKEIKKIISNSNPKTERNSKEEIKPPITLKKVFKPVSKSYQKSKSKLVFTTTVSKFGKTIDFKNFKKIKN